MSDETIDSVEALKKRFTAMQSAFGGEHIFVFDLDDDREEKVINSEQPKLGRNDPKNP